MARRESLRRGVQWGGEAHRALGEGECQYSEGVCVVYASFYYLTFSPYFYNLKIKKSLSLK